MRWCVVLAAFLIGSVVFVAAGYSDDDSCDDDNFDSGSSSDSSEEGRHHHHHHHGPRPRPPRPPPGPPPPPPTPAYNPCPTQWLTFDRSGYRWCVLVVHSNVNYYTSVAQCTALGGTLSGVQTDEERLALAAEGRRIQQANGIPEGSIWLGARRKASCPRVGVCAPLDTFAWIDGETTGTAGMTFATNQPDGQIWSNGITAQDCLQQFIFPYSDVSTVWPNIAHGSYDDQWCSKLDGPVNRFFACGKRA